MAAYSLSGRADAALDGIHEYTIASFGLAQTRDYLHGLHARFGRLAEQPWHTASSQGVMAAEGLPIVGWLLGHWRYRTTAGHAHIADGQLVEAAEMIGGIIAEAMEVEIRMR